jgi:YD repeat-containing protein
MSQTSQPYAPGGTEYWTTYTYDASGRALTAVQADGSTTTYLYQGNDVYVWDPAGNWKVFAMDAFANLIIVGEP